MGALHEGHASLIRAAKENCDVVFVSIFVNPRQFSLASDLENYPASREEDRALCRSLGVDVLVEPPLDEMWPDFPEPTATTVAVGGVALGYEGADRRGHFDGVASVVTKLLVITGTCVAFFGEKDYQQLAVIRQVVRDLALSTEVIGCPTVRDADGLALSSRNIRLSGKGRSRALGLSAAVAAVAKEPLCLADVRRRLEDTLSSYELEVAYAAIVHPETLVPLQSADVGAARVLLAAVVEGTRLLDNGPVTVRP